MSIFMVGIHTPNFDRRQIASGCWLQAIQCDGFGDLDPVDGCGKDAAGVARALACRVEKINP